MSARIRQIDQFNGLDVVVVDDDDERMVDIEPWQIGCDGSRIYCRSSLWKRIQQELDQLPKGAIGTLQ